MPPAMKASGSGGSGRLGSVRFCGGSHTARRHMRVGWTTGIWRPGRIRDRDCLHRRGLGVDQGHARHPTQVGVARGLFPDRRCRGRVAVHVPDWDGLLGRMRARSTSRQPGRHAPPFSGGPGAVAGRRPRGGESNVQPPGPPGSCRGRGSSRPAPTTNHVGAPRAACRLRSVRSRSPATSRTPPRGRAAAAPKGLAWLVV